MDPLNDEYHFILSQLYIKKAEKDNRYIELAIKEVREAMRINPWNEFYPEFLQWTVKTLSAEEQPI